MQETERVFHQLDELTAEYAEAEAARVYLHEFRKSKKAILMKQAEAANSKLSAAAQEREAYADPEYNELLKGLQAATEKALFCKHKMLNIKMRFEHWRTKQSNERAEKQLR